VRPAIDKAAVSRNFSAAAPAYDAWAGAQDRIAEDLVARLPPGLAPARVVELGCGTGLLTTRLLRRFPAATVLGLDLAEGMVEACRRRFHGEPRARFEVADAEDPRAARPADLVALSCTAQWFADPETTLRGWAGALRPGGSVAAALLVHGSYAELSAAYREAFGVPFPGLALPSVDEALALLGRARLVRVRAEGVEVVARHASARDALASFRGLGAVLRDQPGRTVLGAGRARRLLAALARGPGAGGRLTHRVLHAVARRAP
jgi:malonyl-CoA O-methyltransferase